MPVLFYDAQEQAAAVAYISADGTFRTSHSHAAGSLGRWSHIVRRGDLWLFYRDTTGAAAVTAVEPSGLRTTATLAPGSLGRWTHVVNTAHGLLFYDRMTGAAAVGQLTADGITTSAQLPRHSFGDWTHLVACDNAMLCYNRLSGAAAIAHVTPTGVETREVFDPRSFSPWSHIVANGRTVLFYSRDTGAGLVAHLDARGLSTLTELPAGSFSPWSHLAVDGPYVLFYDDATGAAAVGELSTGRFRTLRNLPSGSLSQWSHVAAASSSGPEEYRHRMTVLLCHFPAPGLTTLGPDYYRRYFFDLTMRDGVGRFWLDQSGGRLRLEGTVSEWVTLPQPPSHPSTNENREALAYAAIKAGLAAGWTPGNAASIVIVVACDRSAGVDAGALLPLTVDGRAFRVALIHGGSQNWINTGGNVTGSNYRFDFNAHEVGHNLTGQFGFNHAFGPGGPYFNRFCVMSAMWYAGDNSVEFDRWTPSTARRPEETTKGPGLAGCTRAGCGWARVLRLQAWQLAEGVEVELTHLGDTATTLPEVIEWTVRTASGFSTYTLELRSPLVEWDQALSPSLVLCQRQGSRWASDQFWAPLSSTYVTHSAVAAGSTASLTSPGVVGAQVLGVTTQPGARGPIPSAVRLRLNSQP